MQAPKDWKLVLIVLLVTSIAIAVVGGKSISHLEPPVPIRDEENREGRTVTVCK